MVSTKNTDSLFGNQSRQLLLFTFALIFLVNNSLTICKIIDDGRDRDANENWWSNVDN